MPTTTGGPALSSVFVLGVLGLVRTWESGSATTLLSFLMSLSISLVRLNIQTGCRARRRFSVAGLNELTSTSTGAPAALARSDGIMLATNGPAAPPGGDPA